MLLLFLGFLKYFDLRLNFTRMHPHINALGRTDSDPSLKQKSAVVSDAACIGKRRACAW
jgi:hypothetical protein